MKKIIKKSQLRETVNALRSDKKRSAIAALYLSLGINIGYAVLQAINGIVQRSIWAGTLAFYYLILSVIRFSLLLGHKKVNILKKWKKYRRTAFVMLILNFALLGIYCITMYMGHTVKYPGYMIYAIALYTFFRYCGCKKRCHIPQIPRSRPVRKQGDGVDRSRYLDIYLTVRDDIGFRQLRAIQGDNGKLRRRGRIFADMFDFYIYDSKGK